MKKHITIIIFLIILLSQTKAIDISKYRFHTIPAVNYYHGIMEITKDSVGRIWYNGRDALFMYDGNSFTQMDSYISRLFPRIPWQYKKVFTDKNKKLLVLTDKGLLSFNYNTFQFSLILEGDVNFIAQEKDGLIWILRNNQIESFYYSQNPQIKKYNFHPKKWLSGLSQINGNVYFAEGSKIYRLNRKLSKPALFATLNTQNIRLMRQMIGYNEDFFVLTNPGLYRLDRFGKIKKEYKTPVTNEPLNDLKCMYVDAYGVLWVATQNGLLLIDPRNDQSTYIQSKPKDIYSLPHNSIWSIYPDPDGGTWIGTFGGKLAYQNFNDNQVTYESQINGKLNNAIASCFQEDKNGNLWIGTEGGGVNFWNRRNDIFSYYTHSNNKGINYDLIKRMSFDDKKEKLKIAAYNGGIVELNINTGGFHDINLYHPNYNTPKLSVYDFALEENSGIWISNPDENLFYKDFKSRNISQIALINTDGTLIDNIGIECLYRDKNKKLWMFSHRGIFIMNVVTRKIETQFYVPNMPFSANNLICFTKTSGSEIWVGTMGGGLNILNKNGKYINIGANEGFLPKTVFSIVEDTHTKNIWLATDDGVYCYYKKRRLIKKVDIFDSNMYGSFYPKSGFYTQEGEVVFGGTKGFVLFSPLDIQQNKFKPIVFFTSFWINNTKEMPENGSVLSKDISVLNYGENSNDDPIVLSYKQSHIRINFSTNSYLNSTKNLFAYRLIGVSKEWQILPSGQQYIQFFNLSSGSYKLEVKAANSDGIWGDYIARLQFKITPPFWFSIWAYLFYIILVFSIIRITLKFYENKKVFNQKLQLEKLKEHEMKKLIQLRVDFFTNISHDLKTPLMLVVNLLKKLKDFQASKETVSEYIQLMERNVEKIQRMINQLLLFREIENDKMIVKPENGDLFKYVSEIFSLFEPYAEKKNIEFNLSSYKDKLFLSFDRDILEKILFNLISNAIKYSPKGESVYLNINKADEEQIRTLKVIGKQGTYEYVLIEIINTGVEIDDNQKHKLFKSFSRLSDNITDVENSTGLGLSIVKQLVNVLNGAILLESKDKSVIFRVIIPFATINENENIENQFSSSYTVSELNTLGIIQENVEELYKGRRKLYDLVIMEDNTDLRNYIEKELSKHFNVYVADNGEAGLALVRKVNPHLVITDLMMPHMDGFEVCKALKSDIKISHTPIIMMSALGTETNKVKGLKDGADVFVEKPFDINFLIEQANNLIKSRESLKKYFSKKFTSEPSQITYSTVDENLLKKAIDLVEKNIDNSDYNVESFVSDMGIGRTLLYQKINEITDMSIKEFILNMRLKRSVQLLENTHYTISEIAYQSGFNDAKYFSVCFKKHYSISPSDFKSKNKDLQS